MLRVLVSKCDAPGSPVEAGCIYDRVCCPLQVDRIVLERINECKTQSADDKEQIITSESHVTSQRQRANGDLGVLLVLL
jgi:hypothetical protein